MTSNTHMPSASSGSEVPNKGAASRLRVRPKNRRRIVVLGNPENRRVQGFCAAAETLGIPTSVRAHLDVLRNPHALDDLPRPLEIRMESTGENPDVADALLDLGHEEGDPRPADKLDARQLLNPKQHHRGFLRYLDRLSRVSATWWTHPEEIGRLFDKRACSRTYATAGIPVPETLEASSREELLDQLQTRGWRAAVMKASFGSSTSCLAVVGSRRTMTTLRWNHGWFNSLRVQRVVDPAAQDRVFEFLADQAPQIERMVPKARLEGAFFDCRVLTIAGEPRFIVVRQSHHPITNLHLGGWRGDLGSLRAFVPPASWEAAMESCRRVAACHRAHHLGIDLMFEPGMRRHRVIEANAFGDLLPGLMVDGLDVYGVELVNSVS